MGQREMTKCWGRRRKEKIEKFLQKAVHSLIRQRGEGRAWESLVKQKILEVE